MVKHYVYVVVHKKTGKLLSQAFDQYIHAEQYQKFTLNSDSVYNIAGKPYPMSQTEVVELRVRK